MARKPNALVVALDEAAEALLSTTSFIRREIRDGAIKAIRLGSKTVIRKDELKAYLERKEAEGLPSKKPRANNRVKVPEDTEVEAVGEKEKSIRVDDCLPKQCAEEDALNFEEPEPFQEHIAPEVKGGVSGIDQVWEDTLVQPNQK